MARITPPDTAETEKVTRTRKSPAEKAQFQLDRATSQRARAQERVTKLQGQLDEAKAELSHAEAQVDYASRNPALPAADEVADAPTENGQQEIDGTSAAE